VRPDSPGNGELIRWDPSRGLVDDNDVRRVGALEAVVNLAGAGIADRRWTNERKEEIRRSRGDATALLVRILSDSSGTGFSRVARQSASTGLAALEVLDESSSIGDDFLARVCVEWEQATSPLERSGTKVAHLRTGIVMSSRERRSEETAALFRLGLGGS